MKDTHFRLKTARAEVETARVFLDKALDRLNNLQREMEAENKMQLIIEWDDRVPLTEFSLEYIQGMADRMMASFKKYGPAAEAYPEKIDAMASGDLKRKLYLEGGKVKGKHLPPGNKENLMDGSNYDMIEFMYPKLVGAFFKATAQEGTPGRVQSDGTVSDKAHQAGGMETEFRWECTICGQGYCHPLQYCSKCPGRLRPKFGDPHWPGFKWIK